MKRLFALLLLCFLLFGMLSGCGTPSEGYETVWVITDAHCDFWRGHYTYNKNGQILTAKEGPWWDYRLQYRMRYNEAGERIFQEDLVNGGETHLHWDQENKTKVIYGKDATTTIRYDACGNETYYERKNLDGETVQLTTHGYLYDDAGRITREIKTTTSGEKTKKSYWYDEAGNLIRETQQVDDGEIRERRYTYDRTGKLVEEESWYTTVRYTYDSMGRLQEIWRKEGKNIIRECYQRDADGNILRYEKYFNDKLRADFVYTYDAKGRMLSEKGYDDSYSSGRLTWAHEWTYDSHGNRKTCRFGDEILVSYSYKAVQVPEHLVEEVKKFQKSLFDSIKNDCYRAMNS